MAQGVRQDREGVGLAPGVLCVLVILLAAAVSAILFFSGASGVGDYSIKSGSISILNNTDQCLTFAVLEPDVLPSSNDPNLIRGPGVSAKWVVTAAVDCGAQDSQRIEIEWGKSGANNLWQQFDIAVTGCNDTATVPFVYGELTNLNGLNHQAQQLFVARSITINATSEGGTLRLNVGGD